MPDIRRGWRLAADYGIVLPVETGEHALHMVEGPVVTPADGLDVASRTAELPQPGMLPVPQPDLPPDRMVPRAGSGLLGWAGRLGGSLLRNLAALLLIAVVAAVPTHFFVGRVDDTLVAAPALSDLAGGFGLLLLPLMWLAYFAVSALPLLIALAGAVGVVVPAAADGARPRLRTVWTLVAYRLRTLWLWLAPFGLLVQLLPLLDAEEQPASVVLPLRILLELVSAGVLTLVGMLGCVVLIEHGRGLRRALHLLTLSQSAGLILAALAFAVLPSLAGAAAGSLAQTSVAVACGVFWAVAALITYAQARRAEGPVTSVSLRAELAAPDVF